MAGKPRNSIDTAWARVRVDMGGCWEWTGCLTAQGYGVMSYMGRPTLMHRLLYEDVCGVIPPGMVIDHLCRTRHCVNPLHLEVVTQLENKLRGTGAPAVNARKTHCKDGHELKRVRGGRRCGTCAVAKHREWVANRRKAMEVTR